MKKLIFLLFFFFSSYSFAESNDFSSSDSSSKIIAVENLKFQMEIQGEILVFDKSGMRLLYRGNEERRWQFGSEDSIDNNWSFKQKGLPDVALQHRWSINKNGQLELKIQQYKSMTRDKDGKVIVKDLVREKDITVENLSPVSWIISEDDEKRVVVRFQITVWDNDQGVNIGAVGINSSRMTIYDSKGNLWASRVDNSDGNNVYFGITTHMGSAYMSYIPFKGAQKIGEASRGRIKISANGTTLYIESSEFFLPRGITANVYGFIDLNRRTPKFNSVHSQGSDKEENFLRSIKK